MRKLNIFEDVDTITKEYNELHEAIAGDILEEFQHKDWLLNLLHNTLEYDTLDIDRPIKHIDLLYNKFRDLFPYTGKAYHGFCSMIECDILIKRYKGLVSWSSDINVAYSFGAEIPNDSIPLTTNAMIITYAVDGFALYAFLSYIYNIFKYDEEFSFLTKYINEKEILAYLDLNNSEIIDLKGVKIETLKSKYVNV